MVRPNKEVTKICEYCHKEYHPLLGRENVQKFCCTSCSNKSMGKRYRALHKDEIKMKSVIG